MPALALMALHLSKVALLEGAQVPAAAHVGGRQSRLQAGRHLTQLDAEQVQAIPVAHRTELKAHQAHMHAHCILLLAD